ncbi:MAG: iron-siderophore ABC transporter substrate-binding protein [Propionibacteriales bacterium]|nr:iron-siderophore ABC transporter substrate-binding protein [Propionibacteriales bacterium]
MLLTRRRLMGATLALSTLAAAAACTGPSDRPNAPPAGGPGDTFPRTVEHKFGSTEIAAAPQRVVSVGLTEHDVLLQLGVIPVGVTEWYGQQESATWPWATALLGDARPAVLSTADGLQFERIASLTPDLIIGTNAGLEQADYDRLSEIAPTVVSITGSVPYFSPWRDQTLQIARALGREADGQKLIDAVDTKAADIVAKHPDWKGRTATFSQGKPYEGNLWVYPDGLNTDFLTDLGFTITPGLEEFVPETGGQAQISAENAARIDADVIVFATDSSDTYDALMKFATIKNLAAVKERRAVYTDAILAGAIYFMTPLSQLYVLDRLPALLEAATQGKGSVGYPT